MNWAAIIDSLKNLTGGRFYFIVTLIFLLTLGNIYKDTITIAVKEVTFTRVEFRECRDLKGLEVALNIFVNNNSKIVSDYTVYIYQPKDKSYYKKVLLTTDDIVKSTTTLQGYYLEDQPTINTEFKDKSYILFNGLGNNEDMSFMNDLGYTHLLIYKLHYKTTIGEIYLKLKHEPNAQELETLIKGLSPLTYVYII